MSTPTLAEFEYEIGARMARSDFIGASAAAAACRAACEPMKCVVGIDLGTQSLKAVVCDEAMTVLGASSRAYETRRPRVSPGPGASCRSAGPRARFTCFARAARSARCS